jgi:hypothetical protein
VPGFYFVLCDAYGRGTSRIEILFYGEIWRETVKWGWEVPHGNIAVVDQIVNLCHAGWSFFGELLRLNAEAVKEDPAVIPDLQGVRPDQDPRLEASPNLKAL